MSECISRPSECIYRPASSEHKWLWHKSLPGDKDHYPGVVFKCLHCKAERRREPEKVRIGYDRYGIRIPNEQ